MRIGFIGLGNVGGKLAGNLLAQGSDLTVFDLDAEKVGEFTARGTKQASDPGDLLRRVDLLITCLPSPAACASRAACAGTTGAVGSNSRPSSIGVRKMPGAIWFPGAQVNFARHILRPGLTTPGKTALVLHSELLLSAPSELAWGGKEAVGLAGGGGGWRCGAVQVQYQ